MMEWNAEDYMGHGTIWLVHRSKYGGEYHAYAYQLTPEDARRLRDQLDALLLKVKS